MRCFLKHVKVLSKKNTEDTMCVVQECSGDVSRLLLESYIVDITVHWWRSTKARRRWKHYGIYIRSKLVVGENLMEDLRHTALLDRQRIWESFGVKDGVAKVFDLCC